ncbi:MAG TPA: thiolase family protein [Ramlibacter sp.]|nr:thiolase family protein [Ramlibacter sp.]
MTTALVSGIGEVHPARKLGQPLDVLLLRAIGAALADAGLRSDQIGAVVTESSLVPKQAPLDRIAPAAGLSRLDVVMQSSPMGAGILAAVGQAFDLVASGKVEHCLTYFGVDWGTSPEGPTEYHERMPAKSIVEFPAGLAGPPLYFGLAAKRYQHLHGLTDQQLQDMLFDVVRCTLDNAARHPHAQNGRPLTREAYLAKPLIAEPLRSADCSLLSDGAMALVISRADKVARDVTPVGLAAWAYDQEMIPDTDFYTQSPWLPALPAAGRSAAKAFRAAGLAPADIDVFELYDCFSIAVILQLEAIGVCKSGQGRELCAGGALRFDGALPTNTHGGLLGHGYLLGAGHVVEALRQLRQEAGSRQVAGARHAFVGAGPGRQYTSLILSRLERES